MLNMFVFLQVHQHNLNDDEKRQVVLKSIEDLDNILMIFLAWPKRIQLLSKSLRNLRSLINCVLDIDHNFIVKLGSSELIVFKLEHNSWTTATRSLHVGSPCKAASYHRRVQEIFPQLFLSVWVGSHCRISSTHDWSKRRVEPRRGMLSETQGEVKILILIQRIVLITLVFLYFLIEIFFFFLWFHASFFFLKDIRFSLGALVFLSSIILGSSSFFISSLFLWVILSLSFVSR